MGTLAGIGAGTAGWASSPPPPPYGSDIIGRSDSLPAGTSMSDRTEWWFPHKQFGWGLPLRWQGWVTLASYVTLMLVALPVIEARWGFNAALLAAIVLSIGLTLVFLIKGEPSPHDPDSAAAAAHEGGTLLKSYRITAYVVAAVFIGLSIPLAMRWVPRNTLYGIHETRLLHGSLALWYRVNQIAGIAGVAAGLLSILMTTLIAKRLNAHASVRGLMIVAVTFVLIIAAVLCPSLAS